MDSQVDSAAAMFIVEVLNEVEERKEEVDTACRKVDTGLYLWCAYGLVGSKGLQVARIVGAADAGVGGRVGNR